MKIKWKCHTSLKDKMRAKSRILTDGKERVTTKNSRILSMYNSRILCYNIPLNGEINYVEK